MKNKFLIVSSVLVFSILGSRCGGSDCARTDCGNPVFPNFTFRVINSAGKDLVVGPSKIYDTSGLKILGKLASTGSVENVKRTIQVFGDTSCFTSLSVSKSYSVYYLSLNNTVTDSLFFTYTSKQTECCDMSYFSFTKRNSADITPPLSLPYATYPIVK
jgi:hypothetical protein